MKRSICIGLICLSFFLLVVLGIVFKRTAGKVAEISFYYNTETSALKINTWFDDSSNTYYLFLPSYVDANSLQLSSKEKFDLRCLDGSGEAIPLSECNDSVVYRLISKRGATDCFFCIKRLSNIHTLFIDTESGTTKKIHRDKNIKEEATLSLFDEDGKEEVYRVKGKIKGRGSSTWKHPKKSYLFHSVDSIDLLGTGSAYKWVLLSNSYDESNLRNKLAFDFSKQLGMSTSPDCEYVDLYFNGDYVGLYLLTEKVEFGENRVNIEDKPGYLFTLTFGFQTNSYKQIFEEFSGVTVALTEPENVEDYERVILSRRLKELDDRILSDDSIVKVIDMDSWAMNYIVDELFANSDAGFLSTYFYTSRNGNIFYKGPVWDYDRSLGNNFQNKNARAFLAGKKAVTTELSTPYYYYLMKDTLFRGRVINLYKDRVLPLINTYLDHYIDSCNNKISASSENNSLRWHLMYSKIDAEPGRLPSNSSQQIKDYLGTKKIFLESAWIDGVDYHIVLLQYPAGLTYNVLSIKDGDCLADSLLKGLQYKYKGSDVTFTNTPITDDCELVLSDDYRTTSSLLSQFLGDNKIIQFLILFVILLFIASFILILVKNL